MRPKNLVLTIWYLHHPVKMHRKCYIYLKRATLESSVDIFSHSCFTNLHKFVTMTSVLFMNNTLCSIHLPCVRHVMSLSRQDSVSLPITTAISSFLLLFSSSSISVSFSSTWPVRVLSNSRGLPTSTRATRICSDHFKQKHIIQSRHIFVSLFVVRLITIMP